MRLLVDTDAFCKLAGSDLLQDAVAIFGADIKECGRLPALPHMLRRGSLPSIYGQEECKRLIPTAEGMPGVEGTAGPWLERLTPIPAIDPGEAILFAAAAEKGLFVISGDIRALRALRDVEGTAVALEGRVVTLEAILLSLCQGLGPEVVRKRTKPIQSVDTVARICFSRANRNPKEGLRSYFKERRRELAPLVLWEPQEGEG